jgi:hypothetical protein
MGGLADPCQVLLARVCTKTFVLALPFTRPVLGERPANGGGVEAQCGPALIDPSYAYITAGPSRPQAMRCSPCIPN